MSTLTVLSVPGCDGVLVVVVWHAAATVQRAGRCRGQRRRVQAAHVDLVPARGCPRNRRVAALLEEPVHARRQLHAWPATSVKRNPHILVK